eukprot:PLAT11331.2.p2 GENE.PLAT11331.2~~PLAT11331.2.p2  ORF type:complete len:222 (+),score=40.13 PLAT11331.2:986-1651(+)
MDDIGGHVVKTQLWDTAGADRFRSITRPYYRGAHGAVICYDSSSRESFERVPAFYESVTTYGMSGVRIVVVACKSDLPAAVEEDEAREVVAALGDGIPHISVCARESAGTEQMFLQLMETLTVDARRGAEGRADERMVLVRAAAYASKSVDMPIRAWLNCLKPKLATRFADAFESDGIATLATLLSRDVSEELLLRLGVDVIGAQELLMGAVAAERRAHAL